jgi:predicted transcriptional regulator
MLNCLPQKTELLYAIPAIRKELVSLLQKKNLNDSDIAKKLGITKSAVSQYKHGKRAKKFAFPQDIKKSLYISAEKIYKGKNSNVEISKILNQMHKTRCICKICGCKCKK